jgi:phage tail-like protein
MAISNVYAAAHFALELDGKKEVSLFRSVEGGGVKADVMNYQPAANDVDKYQRWRLLGKPKFEDIKLQVGMAMSQPFYEWMKDFFDGVPTRKNGAIIAADFYYKERARRTFSAALIKEMTFPKLDASDKNAVYMNIALAVEDIAFTKGSGEALPTQAKGFDVGQKHWTANNFSFSLQGFEDHCRRVTKIDSFTIKQTIVEHHVGGFKAAIKTPSAIDYPNITFYLPEADAQPFFDHMQTRVGYGFSGGGDGKGYGNGEVRDSTTMHGSIQTYDNEMRPIFSLDFDGADIVSVTPDKGDATSEEIKMVKVELYTEKMSFFYPVMELE